MTHNEIATLLVFFLVILVILAAVLVLFLLIFIGERKREIQAKAAKLKTTAPVEENLPKETLRPRKLVTQKIRPRRSFNDDDEPYTRTSTFARTRRNTRRYY